MERQYTHGSNPGEYGDYSQQMMYSVAPGQQVVGPPLVAVQGVPNAMPPHLWPDAHLQHPGARRNITTPPASSRGGLNESMVAGADMLEEILGPFPVVRLRGLPFEAQMRDIILFFQGIGVVDVVMMQRGEAMVLFNTVMDCQMALGRDRQNMGRRYIEIFQAKRFDYYNAIAHGWEDGRHRRHHHHPNHPHHHPRGNEKYVVERDGQGQGHPHHHHPHAHHLHHLHQQVHPQQQQHMHPQQQQQAHHTHHVAPTAGTPPATPAISREAAIAASERAQNSGILKLRGLPFSCTKQDVTQFFEGFSLRPEGIQFVFKPDGRLTGEAFISFTTAEEARRAHRTKDRSTLGSRYVEIFPTTSEECARSTSGATQQHYQHQMGMGATAAGNSSSNGSTTTSASSETTETNSTNHTEEDSVGGKSGVVSEST